MTNKPDDIYYRSEWEALSEIRNAIKNPRVPHAVLAQQVAVAADLVERLLRDSSKLIKIGDINERKLITGNQQIQSQKAELVKANAELESLNRILQSANEQKGKLLKTVSKQQTELKRMTLEDGLTGLPNRRFLDIRLAADYNRARRYKKRLTIAMVDIDFFKRVNDTFSHDMGDRVLKTVATVLSNSCRDVDFVSRYGGEEFVMIFPETAMRKAQNVCERMRKKIETYRWQSVQLGLALTISIGLCNDLSFPDFNGMLAAADSKMYLAKQNGRNQVMW